MTTSVSQCRSSQPENSASRVFSNLRLRLRFLLGLAPDGGCLSRRVTATLVRFYIKSRSSAPFHQFGGRWSVVGGQLSVLFCPPTTDHRPPLFRFCGPVPTNGFRRLWSPLTTVLLCGVRTFLTISCNETARPSSTIFTTYYNARHQQNSDTKHSFEYSMSLWFGFLLLNAAT